MEQLTDLLRRLADAVGGLPNLVGLVVGVLVLLFVLRFLRRLLAGRRGPAQERGVTAERLADLPPAPAGPARVRVEGRPARVRLVVVAPVGKDAPIEPAAVEKHLDQVVYGLGTAVRQDRPRIRVWPAQLSNKGFAMTFVRLMVRPGPAGEPSRWVLLAGQTARRPRPIMLGLVLQTEEPNSIGHLTVAPDQWASLLQVT